MFVVIRSYVRRGRRGQFDFAVLRRSESDRPPASKVKDVPIFSWQRGGMIRGKAAPPCGANAATRHCSSAADAASSNHGVLFMATHSTNPQVPL